MAQQNSLVGAVALLVTLAIIVAAGGAYVAYLVVRGAGDLSSAGRCGAHGRQASPLLCAPTNRAGQVSSVLQQEEEGQEDSCRREPWRQQAGVKQPSCRGQGEQRQPRTCQSSCSQGRLAVWEHLPARWSNHDVRLCACECALLLLLRMHHKLEKLHRCSAVHGAHVRALARAHQELGLGIGKAAAPAVRRQLHQTPRLHVLRRAVGNANHQSVRRITQARDCSLQAQLRRGCSGVKGACRRRLP